MTIKWNDPIAVCGVVEFWIASLNPKIDLFDVLVRCFQGRPKTC